MKRFWAVFAMFFVFAFSTTPVEAKKFGGSRSFGKTHQTATQPAAKTDVAQQQQMAPGQGAAAGAAKKGLMGGMMGGLLGGLLAGGLFAALLGSGAFEGLQMMDILIMALLAFVIFKLLRSRRPAASTATPAYAGTGMGNAPNANPQERRSFDLGNPSGGAAPVAGAATAGFGASAVPFNLPAGFDLNGFLAGARDHYRTLQDAWNKNDLTKIQEYVSPELFDELSAERATLQGEQHTDVMFVDAELVRANQTGQLAEVSVRFSGRFRDTVEGVEEPITDIWHLERDLSQPGAPWYIVGIEA